MKKRGQLSRLRAAEIEDRMQGISPHSSRAVGLAQQQGRALCSLFASRAAWLNLR